MAIAPNWHARTQSPAVKQPYGQSVLPEYTELIMAHVLAPSYVDVVGRLSHVPLQRNTATIGLATDAASPTISPILRIVSALELGQCKFESVVADTQAQAKSWHPLLPQPPQFAPGSNSSTSAMRGSSST
jgi:hypothetical protein